MKKITSTKSSLPFEERIGILNLVARERPDLSELQIQRKASQIIERIENGEFGDVVYGEVIGNAKTSTI